MERDWRGGQGGTSREFKSPRGAGVAATAGPYHHRFQTHGAVTNRRNVISWAVEVSTYRFEIIAIAQPPVLNSYPNADLL
jgi:hypothetical protein